MKPHVCTKHDLENEIIDVFLVVQVQGSLFERWMQGFDEEQWKEADLFAQELASVLRVSFIGDTTSE